MLILVLTTAALAGYGDAIDGYPSVEERKMHLWTNAARVAPEDFNDDYNSGGCDFEDFEPDEQTAKAPMAWVYELNVSARLHSIDMYENNFFDHTNLDGESPSDRAAAAGYSGGVGENIAYGYGGGYSTVMVGWMCSSGHRANIMTSSYTEMGPGEDADYFTQNFGSMGQRQRINMGVHEATADGYEFWADFYYTEGPEKMQVVVNGVPHDMDLLHGEAESGIYYADLSELDLDPQGTEPDCYSYFFRATYASTDDGEARFPEDGSWGIGGCDYDDSESKWMDFQFDIAGEDDASDDELLDGLQLVGCSVSAGAASLPAALLGLLAVARRRWPDA